MKTATIVGAGALSIFAIALLTNDNNRNQNGSSGSAGGNQASAGESFLGRTDLPRGMSNNNAGNIKLTNPWQGKVPDPANQDGTFEQFQTFVFGIRANTKLLKNYVEDVIPNLNGTAQDKVPNLKNIIKRWDLGNNNYLQFLVNKTGWSATQPLTPDKNTLRTLVRWITVFENGSPYDWINEQRFNAAWALI